MAKNRQEAQEMGKRAYEFVKDKVDNEHRVQLMEKIYYAILKEKGLDTN
jgi:hypothetical protein